MSKKLKLWTFRIGRLFFGFSIPSKTSSMWITRTKNNQRRIDHFISLHRSYNRPTRQYIYSIILYKWNFKLIVSEK